MYENGYGYFEDRCFFLEFDFYFVEDGFVCVCIFGDFFKLEY